MTLLAIGAEKVWELPGEAYEKGLGLERIVLKKTPPSHGEGLGGGDIKVTLIEPAMIKNRDFSEKPSWQLTPLTLAALAGITPPDVEVEALDDRIEEIDHNAPRDLVGITVKTFTARRAYQIADEFRRLG